MILRLPNYYVSILSSLGNDRPFDYISVTPPYTQVDYGVLMGQLSKSALVGEDTFIVSCTFLISA